jgi:hypothetical protein
MSEEKYELNKDADDRLLPVVNEESKTEEKATDDKASVQGMHYKIPCLGICATCGQASKYFFGYQCNNRVTLSKDNVLHSERWCGSADHITYLCRDCIGTMFREDPTKEKPIIVDEMPSETCWRFEYLLQADLKANKNRKQSRLDTNRGLNVPSQQRDLVQHSPVQIKVQTESPQNTLDETICK